MRRESEYGILKQYDDKDHKSPCGRRSAYMFLEIIKAILMGIVEGITEWLPISSTDRKSVV